LKEFDFINKYIKPIAPLVGDDCVFYDGYAVTKDVLISGVHFFENDEPFNLARKSLRVNLSDLAACGAVPFGFMLGLALPKNTTEGWLSEFAKGLKADIDEFDFALLGGDTTKHDGALVISVTAIGKTVNPLKRSGAKVGDNIFVSGNIGDSFIGLKRKPIGIKDQFTQKYDLPNPQVALGQKLVGVATSCIDISDGLLADLNHICIASNVGAEIDAAQIPTSKCEYDIMQLITAGDDYELCFTAPVDALDGCYKIGKIVAGSGIKLNGRAVAPKGFEH
jgi:thiamine-monophosphate kinase